MLFWLLITTLANGAVALSTVYHNKGASVQLFEWSWSDVANECETFLSKKGFRAVQISPPQEHIAGAQWWTRYQPVSYKLVSRSGDETAFDDMVRRCRAVGVEIVADAVINHMAAGSGTSINGTSYTTRTFPGLYSPNDFHHDENNVYKNCQVTQLSILEFKTFSQYPLVFVQVTDYTNKYNVQYCDLVGLPDLATSSVYVQSTLASYLNNLYKHGVRGIRIDAAKHQDASEMQGITKQLPGDMYVGMEVIGGSGEAVQPSMYYNIGQVSEFYYADYLDTNIINENKMVYLQTLGESWGLMPDQYAVAFLDK
jgi:alpha-amylase